jgi:hypothetical protein
VNLIPAIKPERQNPMTTEPITLSQLVEKLPPFVDEEVEDLGTFRLHRLTTIDVLEFQSLVSEIADEEGNADRKQAIAMSMDFVAKSLGGEFATEQGKQVLMTMPFTAQTKLIGAAMNACRANTGDRIAQIEEAKND